MEEKIVSSGRSSTAMAFLVGAVAGGITALLFAPQTGAQMRGQLKRGARSMRDRGGDLAHNMQDRAGNMKGAVSEARIAYRGEMEKRNTSPRAAVVETGEQA